MEIAVVFMRVSNSQNYNPNDFSYTEEECIKALSKMGESEYVVAEVKPGYPTSVLSCEIMEQLNFYDDNTEEEEKGWIIEDNQLILDSIGVTDYDEFLRTHWCAAFNFSKEELLEKINNQS